MKNHLRIYTIIAITFVLVTSCEKDNESTEDEIKYQSVNKEYVFIRDVETLKTSDDDISEHVDSILTGLIQVNFVSTGRQDVDLIDDASADLGFEIIDLNEFNPNGIPESFDTLAARVIPLYGQVLDNSTFGYVDALVADAEISSDGHWSGKSGVLGTFAGAGQFNGKGEKYLGIRFPEGDNFRYGWAKIYCSQHNDTLRIIDFAVNYKTGNGIKAGQKK